MGQADRQRHRRLHDQAAPAQDRMRPVIEVMESAGTPTVLGMTGNEWEAFGYGLKDGIKVWRRTHIKYSEIDKLDISPQIKTSLKEEFHYYEIGSDLPEDIALLILGGYLAYTDLPALMKLAGTVFGAML